MNRRTVRRALACVSVAAVVSLAAACAPTGSGGGPATHNFSFSATSVKVNSSNDQTCVLGICVNNDDEPYAINIGFTVKIGVPNSATDSVIEGDVAPSIGAGSTDTLSGNESGTVVFPNVPLLDVGDLLNTNNHLEVAGVWAWAMESDLVGVGGIANTAGDAIKAALNSTLAVGSVPSDPNQLVSSILGVVGNNIFPLLGDELGQIVPFIGDDGIGSRFYVGLGVTGTLKSIVDAAVGSVSFPTLAIPVVSIPPDIDGGAIFSLAPTSFTNQVMTNGGVQGQHTYSYSLSES